MIVCVFLSLEKGRVIGPKQDVNDEGSMFVGGAKHSINDGGVYKKWE